RFCKPLVGSSNLSPGTNYFKRLATKIENRSDWPIGQGSALSSMSPVHALGGPCAEETRPTRGFRSNVHGPICGPRVPPGSRRQAGAMRVASDGNNSRLLALSSGLIGSVLTLLAQLAMTRYRRPHLAPLSGRERQR